MTLAAGIDDSQGKKVHIFSGQVAFDLTVLTTLVICCLDAIAMLQLSSLITVNRT